jgi:murein DD-endopeptidase MepM/ murein hydrolase activator NlpD
MPSVGTAYVNIRVNTKGFEKSLDSMLKRLSRQMETGGKKLGDDFVKGLSSSNTEKFFRDLELRGQKASTKMSNDFKKVERSLDDVGLTASDAGDMMQSSFARTSSTLQTTNDDLRRISNTSKDVSRSGRQASSSLKNIGGGSGFRSAGNDAGFFSNALNSLSRQGVSARQWLSGLHDMLAFTGTAAGAAVGGLVAAGQGIFALGASAAATAPALGVLAGGLTSLGQVGAVVAISMHGVGEAVTAGFKSVDKSAAVAGGAVGGMGKATAAASRAVRDAKQNLAQAYQDAARAAADASRRVQDAERALASAQRDSAIAQKELNAAREEALQQLKEIGFAAEDAALAEDRAALALGDAQDKLASVSELAPDDRARVEAELSFKEADLNYREAKNRRERADKDQRKAAKTGVEGTDAMIDAHNAVADAQRAEADAGRDLADARREQGQTAQDNARKIADAQQALADAQSRLTEAQKEGTAATKAATTAADAYKTALDKLSPKQREFVKRLIELGPKFRKARNEIADPLFGGLLDGLNTVVKSPTWQQVVDKLEGTSTVLGDLVRRGADAATKPPFSTALVSVMDNNNDVIENFGNAAGNLAGAFIQIADAAGPTLLKFSEWTEKVTGSWNATATLDNKTGKLDGTISRAGDRVAEFKDLFVGLWGWLKKVGGAALEASESFKWTDKKGNARTGYIPKLTESLNNFTASLDHDGMVDRFTTSLETLDSEGRALKSAIIDPLLIMGSDKRIGDAFDIIGKSDAFKDLATHAGEAAPGLARLVVNLVDLFNSLSESGSLKVFVDTLADFVGFIGNLVDMVPVPVLKGIGTALGTIAAIRFAGGIGKKLFSTFVPPPGLLKGLQGLPGNIRGAAGKATSAGIAMEEAGLEVAAAFETGFGTGIKTLAATATRAVKAALPKTGLVAAGSEFATGLTIGIEEATPALVLAAESMARSALTSIKAIWQIKSPSAVATGIGVNIGESYATGLRESTVAAEAAAAQMGASSVTALKEGSAGAGAVGATTGAAAGGGGAAGLGGAAAGEVGKVGKFAGVMGKFGKAAGPLSKMMKPLSLGIRGIGSAMRFAMGPWGMAAMIIIPLVWPLLVKLEKKTHIFSKTLSALGDAASWVWKTILQPMFGWIKDVAVQIWDDMVSTFEDSKGVLSAIGDAFQWVWDKIVDVFDWVKKNWPTILAILTGPIGIAVLLITKHWDAISKTVTDAIDNIKGFLGHMWDKITSGLSAAWASITGKWEDIKSSVSGWRAQLTKRIGNIWAKFTNALSSAWSSVKGAWKRIKDAVSGWRAQLTKKIGNLWAKFYNALVSAWGWVTGKWANIKRNVGNWRTQLTRSIGNVWAKFSGAFKDAWNWIVKKWGRIKTTISGWGAAIKGSLSKIWDGMGSGLVGAVNWVREKILWLIGKLNTILGKFGASPIKLKWSPLGKFKGFAEGGPVRGPGGPKEDKILARLSSGEHVLTASEVKALGGHQRVTQLRKDALRGVGPTGTGGSGSTTTKRKKKDSGGGILNWFGDRLDNLKSLGDVLKKGYEAAFKWALSKFKKSMNVSEDSGIVKRIAYGAINSIAGRITGMGKHQDDIARAAAAAAAASSSGGGTAAVWRALRSIGLSKVQTAGVMGNMQSESGFDPFIVQGGGHSMNPAAAGGGGYGLVQWTPGRKLIPYLKGKKPSINAEVTALAAQLAGRGSSPEGGAGARLRAAKTIGAATRAFELGYERHAGGPQGNRITQAQHWYNVYKGSDAMEAAGGGGGAAYTGPASGWTYPVSRHVPISQWPGGHHLPKNSMDFDGVTGDAIRAASTGRVNHTYHGYSDSHGRYGNHLIISHAGGISTLYAHLASLAVRQGQSVRTGQKLGMMGTTGHSTGVHLHFEVRGDGMTDDWLRRHGVRLAKGGVVAPSVGGTMAMIAEAGKSERVTPLDREGFTPAERQMLETLQASVGGSGGGGDIYNVHPAPGMNEAHLADMVARRVSWKRRRGGGTS